MLLRSCFFIICKSFLFLSPTYSHESNNSSSYIWIPTWQKISSLTSFIRWNLTKLRGCQRNVILVLLLLISFAFRIFLSEDNTASLNSPLTIKSWSFFCKTPFKADGDFAFRQYGAGGGLTGFPSEFIISYCWWSKKNWRYVPFWPVRNKIVTNVYFDERLSFTYSDLVSVQIWQRKNIHSLIQS